ncbi:MAG: metallophosphoesterase [Clostridia bacterium]|nr:metallophosphoesterase [Clostridia bacterium]
MKKVISVLLTLIMVFGMFAVTASAESAELTITVANDLHYNLKASTTVTKRNNISEDFSHIGSSGRMVNESVAIIKAFLEKAATNESDVVILPGDLTELGTIEENMIFAALLREFEATAKKQVYVVPGNHDLYKTTVDEFRTIYAEFGYAEALAKDTLSASYTVDLNDDYRLLAIDSCDPGESPHGMTTERIQWIAEQGEKAKEDGKKLVAMMHHNLLEHFVLGTKIHSGAIVNSEELPLADALAKAGAKYIFTGHTHDHDIKSYTAEDGTVIYDAVTATLDGYMCPYRVVTFGDEVKIETRSVDAIDTSILPEGISENALALAESNFLEYTKQTTNLSCEILFNSYTKPATLKKLLKLEDEEMNAIIDKVGGKLNEALNMPLEKEDETEAGKSIESIVAKYDTIIPDTDYKSMIDLAVALYQAHNIGDENFPAYSDEVIALTRGLAAVLSYSLEDVTAEEYAKVLSFLTSLTGVTIPVDFLTYAGDGLKRFEGIEILVTTAILPLIVEFTVDDAPADKDATLPGYDELKEEEKELSFWEKLVAFFEMLFTTVRTLFAFLPF